MYFGCLFQRQVFWPEPVKHVNEMYEDLQTELFIANILKNKQANKQTKTWCMLNEQGDSIDENCKNLTHIQNLDHNISLKAFFFSVYSYESQAIIKLN